MRSKCSLALIICLTVCLIATFSVTVSANDTGSSQKKVYKVSDESGRLTLLSPDKSQVFYNGEKYNYKIEDKDIFDPESIYDDMLDIEIIQLSNNKVVYQKQYDYFGQTEKEFEDALPLDKLANGNYRFSVTHSKGRWQTVDEYNSWFDYDEDVFTPIKVYADFKVSTLKPPKSLKVKAGKKKVVISYTKAAGAKKYQIYRYSKKAKKYKLIGSTSKLKFVDKKVKKGNKYKYKVRSYRYGKGTVKSKFTSVRTTKKVK